MKTFENRDHCEPIPFENIQLLDWTDKWQHRYAVRFLGSISTQAMVPYAKWCCEQGFNFTNRYLWSSLAFADTQDRASFILTWVKN